MPKIRTPIKSLINKKLIHEKKSREKEIIYSNEFKQFVQKNKGVLKDFLIAVKKLPKKENAIIKEGKITVEFLKKINDGVAYKVNVGNESFFVKKHGDFTKNHEEENWESETMASYQEKMITNWATHRSPNQFKAVKELEKRINEIKIPKEYNIKIIEHYFGFENRKDNYLVSKYYELEDLPDLTKTEQSIWHSVETQITSFGFRDAGEHNMFFDKKTKTFYLFDLLN